jgi:NADP-dependent 3-hydroxy acid dehydrogenase YdfG
MNEAVRKVALISGSSAGLGKAAARALAGRGFDLFLGGRSRERLEAVAAELRQIHPGGRFVPYPFDVRRNTEIEDAVAECGRHFERLDAVVTSAGVGMLDFLDRLEPAADIVPQIETNLTGTVLLVRAALPRMMAQRSGTIVLIGSLAGFIASPTYSIYAATKFGLIGFADALRREVGMWGIRVALLLPGAVATGLAAESVARRRTGFRTPRRMLLTPESVGEAVADLALRPRRVRVIPWWMRPAIWLGRAFPGLVDVVTERFFVRPERSDEL